MSLADDIRQLELARERGDLSEEDFEQQVAGLLRAFTAASALAKEPCPRPRPIPAASSHSRGPCAGP